MIPDRPLVSVIIPVFNTAGFLRDCLDSLLRQSFGDFEAIVVDDGSTDGSADIVQEYASAHRRFRLLRSPHLGLSAARNRGLSETRGEYVAFLDSDDILPDRAYEKLVEAARLHGASVISGRFDRFTGQSHDELRRRTGKGPGGSARVVESACYFEVFRDTTVWNKLYSVDLFGGGDLRFTADMHYEDIPFVFSAIGKAGRVTLIPDTVYHWRIRRNADASITQRYHEEGNLSDRIKCLGMVEDLIDSFGWPKRWRREFGQYATIVLAKHLFALRKAPAARRARMFHAIRSALGEYGAPLRSGGGAMKDRLRLKIATSGGERFEAARLSAFLAADRVIALDARYGIARARKGLARRMHAPEKRR